MFTDTLSHISSTKINIAPDNLRRSENETFSKHKFSIQYKSSLSNDMCRVMELSFKESFNQIDSVIIAITELDEIYYNFSLWQTGFTVTVQGIKAHY